MESVVCSLERVSAICTNRASQRLANLFHVCVAEGNGRIVIDSHAVVSNAFVEGRLRLVHHLRVLEEGVAWRGPLSFRLGSNRL